jgi:uncharacterized protein
MKTETIVNTAAIRYNESEMRELLDTLNHIIEVLRPEKIICYGARTHRLESWSSCKVNDETVVLTDYDLLFVMPMDTRHRWQDWRQEIVSLNTEVFRIIPIGHNIDYVNASIQKGNRFFASLIHRGIMIYESNAIPLASAPPRCNLTQTEISSFLERHWNLWYKKARKELSRATRVLDVGEREISVYQLQLSASYACIAIIWMYTGYIPETNNFKELLELTEHVSAKPKAIFPGHTKEEKYLLATITEAFTPRHYNHRYNVTAKTVNVLQERVEELHAVAKKLCMERIELVQLQRDCFYSLEDENEVELCDMLDRPYE